MINMTASEGRKVVRSIMTDWDRLVADIRAAHPDATDAEIDDMIAAAVYRLRRQS